MLQIISGKFFKSSERNKENQKGIYYSNFSWIGPLETRVGTLEPVDSMGRVNAYVYSFVNQLEAEKPAPGVLYMTDNREIKVQFGLLSMFFFKAYFTDDRDEFLFQCRTEPITKDDQFVPCAFVASYCDKQVRGTVETEQRFTEFVNKVIALPRKKYETLIRCLGALRNALIVLNYDMDLAYAMLIFSLETLSNEHDAFTVSWDDYPEEVKRALVPVESRLDSDGINLLHEALLKSSNIKAMARFISFVESHVSDDFFLKEAVGVQSPIKKSELRISLRNAYRLRSDYAHVLKPILDQLKIPSIASGEKFYWSEPYLSFRGLMRVADHVIKGFIERGEMLETENFDWRDNLPGIVKMPVAPQYWIWQTAGFEPSKVGVFLRGFFSNFQDAIINKGAIPNLNNILELFEKQFEGASEPDRRKMLAGYILFNQVIVPEHKRPEWISYAERYDSVLRQCSIETIALFVINGQSLPWTCEEVALAFSEYQKGKFKKTEVQLPTLLELRVRLEIANCYLRNGSIDEFKKWMHDALNDAAGLTEIQGLIQAHLSSQTEIDQKILWEPKEKSGKK